MIERYISRDSNQTQKVGEILVSELTGREIICLIGDLGGGKTTFTQGIAKGLGIKERIISPTFIIFRKYKTTHTKILWLYHFDLYRISDPQEIVSLGFEEIILKPGNLVVIEWAEKIERLIPRERSLKIMFKFLGKNTREITFST